MAKVIGFILLAVVALGIVVPAYIRIENDYTCKIEVNDSSKVEWAISNAVNDVKSRGFIVHEVNVKRCWVNNNNFVIQCGGITRGNLLAK